MRDGERDRRHHQHHLPPPHPGGQEDGKPDQGGDHRRAQIGLLQDQQHGNGGGDGGRDQEQRIAHPLPACLVEPSSQRHHQGDLHQLGRLQLQAANIDPALRPLADMADLQHQHQQGERHAIKRPGQPRENADIHQRQAQHHHQAETKPYRLAGRIGFRRAPSRGIQRRIAHSCQGTEQQDVEPGNLEQLGRQAERRLGADQPPFVDHSRATPIMCGRPLSDPGARSGSPGRATAHPA